VVEKPSSSVSSVPSVVKIKNPIPRSPSAKRNPN
jgi:hypothetical protein